MTNEMMIYKYNEHLMMKGYKVRGIESKLKASHDFLQYASENSINVKLLSIREAEEYREHLSLSKTSEGDSRYCSKTINCTLAHLRNFYQFLLTTTQTLRNPFMEVDRMKEGFSFPKNILKQDEMGEFLKSITVKTKDDFKFKLLIELLYSTGARISEIEALTFKDVNTTEGYITIRDDKERQDRKAPLTEICLALLKLYMKYIYQPVTIMESKEGNALLFPHGKKRSLNRWINDKLKRLTGKLDLHKITCHSIRHTIATHLFEEGADIREVQEYLGHRRVKNTEVYTRILTEDLKEVIEQNHPREVLRTL